MPSNDKNYLLMSRIKQAARLLVFICLIVLAGIGIGLSGGVPIPIIKNRRDSEKENIELIESQKKVSDSQQDKL